ncbi:thiolase family protein [Paenibacillus sp. MBLB4367]|uniref:thiolase family protein n=1 Tax=Paenibacillus sp. MBLB4367 TaxID=3384767 RepID=UPI00390830E6
MKEIYVLDGARTAFGGFGQSFKDTPAVELGLVTAKEALSRSGVAPEEIDQIVYGNVIPSSKDAAYLARHIGLRAGVPLESPAMVVNRLCGSGLQAVISAAQSIRLGEANIALAGGVETMSQAPHATFAGRFGGVKLGTFQLEDVLMSTLTDSYIGCGMGITAENLAGRYGIGRDEQDAFAVLSHTRAAAARDRLAEEIVPVQQRTREGIRSVELDELVRSDSSLEKLARLKPAFQDGGSVTAGNASGINDGAVSLVIAGEGALNGRKPLARIVSWGIAGVDPSVMGIGPVPASRMALQRAGLSIADIDLAEINEAFAVQYLAVERELGLARERTNVNGGAVAIGHPVGASGARVLLTLAYELRRRGKRYGLASLCVGGGQGVAMIIENVG